VNLTDTEIEALAVLLIAWQLENAEWFGWEDLPELDEATFEAVVARIQTRGRSLRSWLTGYEIDHDVDAHEIHGRAA
jgi:hypothetical protein